MAHQEHQVVGGSAAAAADRLRIDAATAQVLRAFASEGVQALVLKGPSIAELLYGREHAPPYLDSDLLVRPGDERAAGQVLARLGFEVDYDDRGLPGWWREHGVEWWRAQDGVRVDLHRHIIGIGVPPSAAWATLATPRDTIVVAGFPAPTLTCPARLMHIALHAAQHGAVFVKGVGHLERALEKVHDQDWRAAADLAARLEATEAFAAGLRMTTEGRRVASALGLPQVGSVDVELRSTTPPAGALGFEQLARARGLRVWASMAWRKLFPSREFLIHWYPRARNSRLQLALARVLRPGWVLLTAPQGFSAWRRARRAVRDRT